MSPQAHAPWTLARVQQILGMPRSTILRLIAAGFVTPTRGPRREYRFGFQDVVLLRTAWRLQRAEVPPQRIVRSLARLRERLPPTLPLSGLRITAVGDRVAVRDGAAHWEADSGQFVMDFEIAPAAGALALWPHEPDDGTAGDDVDDADASEWFHRGEAVEAEDLNAAEEAYRQALALDPSHRDALLNLGALLCEAGRCDEALALGDEAIARRPDEPLLHFNRAIALEDLGRDEEALASYERCLALSPSLADAHYNAAVLSERLGRAQRALRHYSAYRRLQR